MDWTDSEPRDGNETMGVYVSNRPQVSMGGLYADKPHRMLVEHKKSL